ncbi:hypothetical protein V8E53_006407 [Lactarius tabidus]
MSSSTSIADTTYDNPLEEPQDGWLQVDEPSSFLGKAHPPPSNKISKPSGLPINTIAHLTHNELWHNPEFMKYVSLVNSLQILLNLWEKSTTCTFDPANKVQRCLR